MRTWMVATTAVISLVVISTFIVSVFTGYSLDLAKGDSMCPTSGLLSITLEKRVQSTEDFIIGNIYVYQSYYEGNKKVIWHRYIGIASTEYDTLLFKGDNADLAEVVPRSAVLRRVVASWDLVKCTKNISL